MTKPQISLNSTAPVFAVHDVASTIAWYRDVLGFVAHPFPKDPPHAFAVLGHGRVEIMVQWLHGYAKPELFSRRDGGVWDAYIRMTGVEALYERLQSRGDVRILDPLCKQFYGDTEFVVADLNGYVLVFSELIQ